MLAGQVLILSEVYYSTKQCTDSRLALRFFVSADFIERQRAFLEGKGKHKQASMFKWLGRTRPLWSLLLSSEQRAKL